MISYLVQVPESRGTLICEIMSAFQYTIMLKNIILTPLTASTKELLPAIIAFSRWNCTKQISGTHTTDPQSLQGEENPV